MKKITQLLSSPKTVTIVALIAAIIIGALSYGIHQKTLTEQFANLDTLTSTATTTNILSQSGKDLTLAFPVGGRIKTVSVKIGDTVTLGQVLASLDADAAVGAINQAQAAYLVAQTAYNKLVNGASTPDVAVSQTAVDSATVAVNNAQQNLIRDLATAYSSVNSTVISNTNSLFSNPQTSSPQFSIAGTVQTDGQAVNTVNSERVDVNATLALWQNETAHVDASTLDQTFQNSSAHINQVRKYLTDLLTVMTSDTQVTGGGSQSTVTTDATAVTGAKTTVDSVYVTITNDNQALKAAQSSLDQAKAALALKQAPARTEDIAIAKAQVESTQGALQVAQGAYNNTVITAPTAGTITNVTITAGQIATANTPAVEMTSQ